MGGSSNKRKPKPKPVIDLRATTENQRILNFLAAILSPEPPKRKDARSEQMRGRFEDTLRRHNKYLVA